MPWPRGDSLDSRCTHDCSAEFEPKRPESIESLMWNVLGGCSIPWHGSREQWPQLCLRSTRGAPNKAHAPTD